MCLKNKFTFFPIFFSQLEFFEVSELSFAQDLIKGKEGMVKKLAGGDQKRTGIFKCIARGFRFIWSCVVG